MAPLGWVPLADKDPTGPEFVPTVRSLKDELFDKPFVMAMPGIMFRNSPASRPCNGILLINCVFRVVLTSPLSVGATASADDTTSTFVAAPATFKAMLGRVRLSPWFRTIPVSCHESNPG